jgi:hypothetical protein
LSYVFFDFETDLIMNTFEILMVSNHYNDQELRLGIQTFAYLFRHVTPKHRKRMSMTLIASSSRRKLIRQLLHQSSLESAVRVVSATQVIDSHWEQADLQLNTQYQPLIADLKKGLSFGLPWVGFETSILRQEIDFSCSLLATPKEFETGESLSQLLRTLYFDQGALKVLQKGAFQRSGIFQNRKGERSRQAV